MLLHIYKELLGCYSLGVSAVKVTQIFVSFFGRSPESFMLDLWESSFIGFNDVATFPVQLAAKNDVVI